MTRLLDAREEGPEGGRRTELARVDVGQGGSLDATLSQDSG